MPSVCLIIILRLEALISLISDHLKISYHINFIDKKYFFFKVNPLYLFTKISSNEYPNLTSVLSSS